MRYKSSLRSFAAPLTIVLAFTGCGEGNGEPRLERTDSASVAILMTYSEDRAASFSSREVRSIGGDDSNAESFYRVASVNTGVDADGNIYVLVADAYRVVVFDSAGRHLRSLGKRGGGPGELQYPLGIAVSVDGAVRVADGGKRKIVQWSSDGKPLEELAMPQGSFAASVGWTGSGLVLLQQIARTMQLLLLNESGSQIRFAAIKGLPTKNVNLNSCGMGFTNMPPIFSPDLVWTNRGNRVLVARNPHYIIETLPAESAFPLHFLPDGRLLTAETDVMDLQRLVIRAPERR